MALSSKTFRIFVSSTFSDLKEERNALQERVFPRLRDLCMAHGFRFQAIDLRWGVSEEAALDQQTVRICLEEIARCQKTALKPNFIVLLGDRYGWCPLPYEIPASEYEEIERRIDDPSTRKLIADWYRRDDNAVPPMYVLQRRTGEYADPVVWEERVERPLRTALLEALAGMDLPEDSRLKYAAAATEQEIVHGAMNVEDAGEHVFCFFRSFLVEQTNGSVAVQRGDAPPSPVDEVLREGEFRHFVDRASHGGFDPCAYAQLANLKGRLKSLLPGKTMKYEARWIDSGITISHLDALCTDVYDSLSREIQKQIARFEKTDPLDEENRAHEEFGEERARFFVGRAPILDTIQEHINSGKRHPLAIIGAPGSGKSALIARAVQQARESRPQAEIVVRFIGAAPASSDGRTLLEDLCRRIGRAYGSEEETPLEYRDLVREFPKRLALATNQKPLVLFLDALDQLSATDRARSLTWLPAELPENVNLVVSSIPGECTDALERKLPSNCRVALGPMPTGEGAELLDRWLATARRTLRQDQRNEVLGKFAKCGMPLYLKLAFEEARCWKSYDDLPFGVDGKRAMSEDVPGLIDDLLRRLSREEEHGEVLVSRSLGYIAAGKNGLTEDELLNVLSGDSEVIQNFQKRSPKSPQVSSLPVVVWSRLRADLEPYLTERQADRTSLISFYHRQFEEAVTRNYLQGDSNRIPHESLARYFVSLPLWSEADRKKTPNLRKLSELPFQQAHGGMARAIKDTLTDFDFMYAKVCALGPQPVIADYELVSLPGLCVLDSMSDSERRALDLIRGALRLSAIVLREDGNQLAGQLLGRLLAFDMPEIRTILEQARKWKGAPWLRPTAPRLERPGGPMVQTIQGHADIIWALAVSPDGQKVVSASFNHRMRIWTLKIWDLLTGVEQVTKSGKGHKITSLAVTPNCQSVICGSEDGTIKILDLGSGEEILVIRGHARRINAVDLVPDGSCVISSSDDATIVVRDLATGAETLNLCGHKKSVDKIKVAPDGLHLVSASSDEGTIKVWNLVTGEECLSLSIQKPGGYYRIKSLALTPNGRCAIVALSAEVLEVWDLVTGDRQMVLAGHAHEVSSVVVVPDGKRVVSGSHDRTLKVWNLETGEEEATFTGHASLVMAISVTRDGKYVVSASADGLLKIWDLGENTDPLLRGGHRAEVEWVTVAQDCRHAVSAAADKTLTVWNLESGAEVTVVKGRKRVAKWFAASRDGRHAVAASRKRPLRLLDLDRGLETFTIGGHIGWITGIAAAPDGKRIISSSDDGSVKVWDLDSGHELFTLKGRKGSANAVALSPDGRSVVLGSSEHVLTIWDLQTRTKRITLKGHAQGVSAVAVTPEGRHVVSGSKDCTVRVWNMESGAEEFVLVGHGSWVNAVAIMPDGGRVISASSDGTLRIWDLETGTGQSILKGHEWGVNAVVVSQDGRHAISGSSDGTLKTWDVEAGREKATILCPGSVDALALLPDGRRVLSVSNDLHRQFWTIQDWDVETGVLQRTITGHPGWIGSLAVTPDGFQAVYASQEQMLKVWDLQTGKERIAIPGHTLLPTSMILAADGRRAVSTSWDEITNLWCLKVWSMETGEVLFKSWGHAERKRRRELPPWVGLMAVTPDGRRAILAGVEENDLTVLGLETGMGGLVLSGHAGSIRNVAVLRDSRQAISCSSDNTLKVWDLETGKERFTFSGHEGCVNSVAVSDDAAIAVSASSDHTLRIWDLKNGVERNKLMGHSASVWEVIMTPDGHHAISTSFDGSIRMWAVENGKCVARYNGDLPFGTIAIGSDSLTIVAGEKSGRVHFLKIEGTR